MGMNENEITEGNRLLAEMCGWKNEVLEQGSEDEWDRWAHPDGRVYDGWDSGNKEGTPPFHSDWNWTMEACRKVDKALVIIMQNMGDTFDEAVAFVDEIQEEIVQYHETPLPVFKVLVEAAKWLNKQK